MVVPDGSEPPPDDPNLYRPSAHPGGRLPHLWVDDGRWLFDALGRGYTFLRVGSTAADPAGLEAAPGPVPLHTLDVPGDAARDLMGADYVLVRPDQHVAWRGNRVPDAVLARLAGHRARIDRPPRGCP